MNTNILLGGPTKLWPIGLLSQLRVKIAEEPLIGVDRGAHFLLANDLTPTIAVGDFDSLNADELADVEKKVSDIRYAKPEKDLTDSQMAILTAIDDLKSDQLTIYGATGGRIDHFLVNLFTVFHPQILPIANHIRIVDRQNVIEFYRAGQYTLQPHPDYRYLAFVPLEKTQDLTIRGAKYNLNGYSTDAPESFASNEFIGKPVTFSFASGLIAVIYSRDWQKEK